MAAAALAGRRPSARRAARQLVGPAPAPPCATASGTSPPRNHTRASASRDAFRTWKLPKFSERISFNDSQGTITFKLL